MRHICTRSISFVFAAAFLLVAGSLRAAQHEHKTAALSVGKTGEVTFTTETQIGGITLKPGRYFLDHRVEGTTTPRKVVAHYIHFTEVTPEEHQRRQAVRDAISGHPVAHPGEIECEVEALPKNAAATKVFTTTEDGIRRITRIEIAGENVAHIF